MGGPVNKKSSKDLRVPGKASGGVKATNAHKKGWSLPLQERILHRAPTPRHG